MSCKSCSFCVNGYCTYETYGEWDTAPCEMVDERRCAMKAKHIGKHTELGTTLVLDKHST